MPKLALGAAIIGLLGLFVPPASAMPITYDYHPTSLTLAQNIASYTLADITLDISITIDGSFSDLPTLSSQIPGPHDFGDLLGFSFVATSFGLHAVPITLASFVPHCFPQPCDPITPGWSVSPDEITFESTNDTIALGFNTDPLSTVTSLKFDSDGPTICFFHCQFTGYWSAEAIPEPASIVLFGSGLIGLAMIRRRRSRAATSCG